VGFASLRTVSFRNLADTETDIRGKDIFLIGANGQGKSNFLEALYFCSYASSFRGAKDRELIRSGDESCSASVLLEGSFFSNVNVAIKDGKKRIALDGKPVEDRMELLSVAPSVIFSHEDMDFAAGTPERRRWFFDQTRSLWDFLYLDDLRKYRHILKSRNSLLRLGLLPDAETAATLDALDPQLAHYGLELTRKRSETAGEFSKVFEPLYREISGIAGIGVKYISSWKGDDPAGIISHLSERRKIDASMGVSLSGPHRDRYVFTHEGNDFITKASTGQRRLLALLLRIAQAKVYSDKTGKKPVLLLDDVLLELDREKRRKFLLAMPEYDQAFYTFLPGELYDSYRKSDTVVYCIKSGKVTGENVKGEEGG
jgi:DNA replication and repair protein RecF